MSKAPMKEAAGVSPPTGAPVCTVCASTAVSREPYYHRWRGKTWWFLRCSDCTHQFIHPRLSSEDREVIYGDAYFEGGGDWVEGVWEGGYADCERKLRAEARKILDMLPASRGRLLDIGCAGGFFLDEARAAGYEVKGIELNRAMVDFARRKLDLDVIHSAAEDLPDDRFDSSFDVVVLLDCLEHVPDPGGVMSRVGRWTAGGGSVFIRGPLLNQRLARLKQATRRLLRWKKRIPGYPLDVNHFNKRSFRALLERSGFQEVAWMDETTDFGNLLARRLST